MGVQTPMLGCQFDGCPVQSVINVALHRRYPLLQLADGQVPRRFSLVARHDFIGTGVQRAGPYRHVVQRKSHQREDGCYFRPLPWSTGLSAVTVSSVRVGAHGFSESMLIGYARVSTNEQETQLQLDALRKAGVRKVYAEKTSGVGPRPELHRALAVLRPGDVLVVYKLDRLARSLKDLLALLDRLKVGGCAVKSLTEPVDTSSAIGELVLQILGAVAQFERSLIRERCEAGRVAARARGVQFGRQPLLEGDEAAVAIDLYRAGLSIEEGAALLGVSFTAFRSALVRHGVARRPRRRQF